MVLANPFTLDTVEWLVSFQTGGIHLYDILGNLKSTSALESAYGFTTNYDQRALVVLDSSTPQSLHFVSVDDLSTKSTHPVSANTASFTWIAQGPSNNFVLVFDGEPVIYSTSQTGNAEEGSTFFNPDLNGISLSNAYELKNFQGSYLIAGDFDPYKIRKYASDGTFQFGFGLQTILPGTCKFDYNRINKFLFVVCDGQDMQLGRVTVWSPDPQLINTVLIDVDPDSAARNHGIAVYNALMAVIWDNEMFIYKWQTQTTL